MSGSVIWQLKTILGGSAALKDLAGLAGSVQEGVSATGQIVSSSMTLAKAFLLTDVNPRLQATIIICEQIIAAIEALENAGFYLAHVDPFTPGVGTYTRGSDYPTLSARKAAKTLAEACTDQGDPNRPQFWDSIPVGALVVIIATGTVDLFSNALKAYGKLFNIQDWEEMAEDIKQIWTPYNPDEVEVSSTPPDFKAIRYNDMIPLVGSGLRSVKSIAQGFKSSAEASSNSIDRLIAFGDKKTAAFEEAVNQFNQDLDDLLAIAESSGVYVLEIPAATGGINRVSDLLYESADQLPEELNLSAGLILVADGASYTVIEEFLL